MSLFDWFANREKTEPSLQKPPEREIADGLWSKCPKCDVLTYTKDLKVNSGVCTGCGHHNIVNSSERIEQLIDFKILGIG
jgi:acetyl-CoA carboxylase carboxyl transferase subunit beta